MGAYKSPESFARVDIWFCLAYLINPNCLKHLSQIMHNSSYLVSLLQILSLQYYQRRSQRRSTGTQIRMNPVSHRSRRNSSVAGAGGAVTELAEAAGPGYYHFLQKSVFYATVWFYQNMQYHGLKLVRLVINIAS